MRWCTSPKTPGICRFVPRPPAGRAAIAFAPRFARWGPLASLCRSSWVLCTGGRFSGIAWKTWWASTMHRPAPRGCSISRPILANRARYHLLPAVPARPRTRPRQLRSRRHSPRTVPRLTLPTGASACSATLPTAAALHGITSRPGPAASPRRRLRVPPSRRVCQRRSLREHQQPAAPAPSPPGSSDCRRPASSPGARSI